MQSDELAVRESLRDLVARYNMSGYSGRIARRRISVDGFTPGGWGRLPCRASERP